MPWTPHLTFPGAVAELSVAATRQYWICPRCYAHVPRPIERCGCGGTKAERKRAHERVGPPPPQHAWIATWVSLVSLGALWMLLK